MVNVAVVGMGFMGVTHIKAYRKIPGCHLAAICDEYRLPVDGDLTKISGNLASSEQVKLDMTQVKAYSKFDDLLQDAHVQLIDICTPTPSHPSLVIAALKAGKHVVCEKPMARNSQLARDMVEAAHATRRFLLPAMCIRFWPEWVCAKNAIARQTYGKVLAARFRRVSEAPGWSRDTYFKGDQSGGALLDLHIHDTDFVQFCFGRPQRVCSSGLSHFSGAIDYVVTQYQVTGGAVVFAEGSWIMSDGHGFNMAYTVVFENATLDYDLARGVDSLKLFEKGQKPRTLALSGEDGYLGELRHMIEAIESGKPPTIVTPQDGLSAVEICEAEERSIKTGQPVSL